MSLDYPLKIEAAAGQDYIDHVAALVSRHADDFTPVAAGLILFPAFTGALHSLLPRRRSVEELYKSSAS